MTKPFDLLTTALGKNILVKLKNGMEVRGTLEAYDPHLNLSLKNAEELKDGEIARKLGSLLIRGDTIVYVSP
ncbi:MAG: small nuclear ribonucleoprotein [Candidatus Altiarchaeota archaeon]|nr:small nuclear ribonucleoprotein [Candidatus Altiarchaeota archaeon]